MARLQGKGISFGKKYLKRSKILIRITQHREGELSPTEIHDLRVTVRRIQVMHKLLPKKIRLSSKQRRYQSALRGLLKSTSEIRDLDILQEALEQFRGSIPESTFEELEAERREAGKSASKVLVRFLGRPLPE